MRPIAILTFLLAMLAGPLALAQTPAEYAGDWKGTLNAGAVKLRVALHIGDTTTFDSLDQGAIGMPASSAVADGKIIVTITGVGSFEGALSADGETLAGILKQGAGQLPLSFTRGSFETARRPQTPQAPFPYRTEDVSYDNPAAPGVRLAGTLTLPEGAGPFPAVVLITGSGSQDRDSTLFLHKPFLVLADHLTRNGVAVLRVDDRTASASRGATAADTSADYATDVAAGVAFLRTRPGIDGARIGLIGHSEGGMIAPMVARDDPSIAFLVLWAGQSVPGKDVVVEQVRVGAAAAGAGPQQAEASAQLQTRLLDAIIAAPDANAARAAAAAVFTGAGLPAPAAAELQQLTSSWYRYFIAYDPAPALKAVAAPMLALLGEKDTQVTPRQNLGAFETAFAGRDNASVVLLAGLNHLFQTAKTGATDEYGEIEETIAPAALDAMTAWIRRQAGLAPQDQPAPPPAGAVVDSFEMVPDRTVILAPREDGRLHILKVTDKDRLAPMPRNPGQVAISLTVAREIGAVLEFNSGLDYNFSYQASTGDAVSIPTCPVRGNAVSQDQWPQGYRSIVVGGLKRVDGVTACEHPAQ
jgi:dienelactone hydrolase